MIINMQAFASSLKMDGTQRDARIFNTERDEFESRRPRDVIAGTNPILILDEPQKLEGEATINGMKQLNPLFALNYSATHRTKHNLIYSLDAIDAFREKLVKRIQVKGFEFRNFTGSSRYLVLERIEQSPKGPIAYIGHDERRAQGIFQTFNKFMEGDNLFAKSGSLQEYNELIVSNIDISAGVVEFQEGTKLCVGDVTGDFGVDFLQRVQISETIRSHFEKEQSLFAQGIKTLSLFFIDKVANYRDYDAEGNELKAKFQSWFEEEYEKIKDETLLKLDFGVPGTKEYALYLSGISTNSTHKGYFSVDSKKRIVDTKLKRDGSADDVDTYDLILKDKEKLLSFDEPTRFIFSHSALQEGWDNPNIFQICTLRSTKSQIKKRQEVGRGLRLCVNQEGIRQDAVALRDRVHEVNVLTVIANESYKDFVDALQKETRETLRDRPKTISIDFFEGKTLLLENGLEHLVSHEEASLIEVYFKYNGYLDSTGRITNTYKKALKDDKLNDFPAALDSIKAFFAPIHKSVQSTFDDALEAEDWIIDGHKPTLTNRLNLKNFGKSEFQKLWGQINHKYAYSVKYDSSELIEKSVNSINCNLKVNQIGFEKAVGTQYSADGFALTETEVGSESLGEIETSVKYDLLGEISKLANITRRTAAIILQSIRGDKFAMYAKNPEEFLAKTSKLIREQKATMIVEHLSYCKTEGMYDTTIFTLDKSKVPLDSIASKKHVMEYVVVDSNVEKELAQALETADDVEVYAKLPRSFQIPTPVGNYAPDWAIAFKKGTFRHLFFVAETKGTMDSMQLSAVERSKIECAKKLFNEANLAGDVRYHQVASYQDLINEIRLMDNRN